MSEKDRFLVGSKKLQYKKGIDQSYFHFIIISESKLWKFQEGLNNIFEEIRLLLTTDVLMSCRKVHMTDYNFKKLSAFTVFFLWLIEASLWWVTFYPQLFFNVINESLD